MLPELGRIGPIPLRTYTILLDLAVLIGLGVLAWYGRRVGDPPVRWLDAGLGALLGGVLGGRLGHVFIYWHYFSEHQSEIIQVWRGGLDWHGAVIGGLIGLWVACAVRDVPFQEATDVLAMVLPVGVVLVYAGCLSSRCGHGAEVASLADYPAFLVAELPDLFGVVAPRFISQGYGIALGVLLTLTAVLLANTLKQDGLRLWIILALLSLGAFGIGFTRGDAVPPVGALRLDQVLDLGVAALSLAAAVIVSRPARPPAERELLPTPSQE